mmetsp:Transcript_4134/g.12581  ORF Transcript_4134/g.12581 Transcript_4134/m.12581 type:complete len:93 (-) Transcript_4134:125-403(-)
MNDLFTSPFSFSPQSLHTKDAALREAPLCDQLRDVLTQLRRIGWSKNDVLTEVECVYATESCASISPESLLSGDALTTTTLSPPYVDRLDHV